MSEMRPRGLIKSLQGKRAWGPRGPHGSSATFQPAGDRRRRPGFQAIHLVPGRRRHLPKIFIAIAPIAMAVNGRRLSPWEATANGVSR